MGKGGMEKEMEDLFQYNFLLGPEFFLSKMTRGTQEFCLLEPADCLDVIVKRKRSVKNHSPVSCVSLNKQQYYQMGKTQKNYFWGDWIEISFGLIICKVPLKYVHKDEYVGWQVYRYGLRRRLVESYFSLINILVVNENMQSSCIIQGHFIVLFKSRTRTKFWGIPLFPGEVDQDELGKLRRNRDVYGRRKQEIIVY